MSQHQTSNVTGRHRGPKRKLGTGYRAPSRHRRAMCHHSYFCLLDVPGLCNTHHVFHRRVWNSAHSLCCARAMHVFDIQASSSPLGYLCAKYYFCRNLHCQTSPWRKTAYSISLFDVLATKAIASE